MTHVLVVEDDAEIRQSVADVIAAHPSLVLAADVGTAGEAIDYVAIEDQPLDVAIVDLGLPDGHGNDVIARITAERPQAACLVFTVLADEGSIFAALRAGARGYLLKSDTPEELVSAVEHAETGGAPLSPEVARKVVESFSRGKRSPQAEPSESGLTPREHQILELLCHGTSYGEVAAMLNIGRGTVQTHVKSIYRKLDVSSKAEATKVAVQKRLFVP